MVRRVFRTRTLIYGAILLGVTGVLAGALYMRVPLKVDIVRDRASLAREVEGGRIENVYRIQLMNTQEAPHRYRIAASGLPGIGVASETEVEVPAATTRQVPLRVQIDPGAAGKGSHRIEIEVQSFDDERVVAREQTVFLVR
jgi:polyferredoxin